MYFAQNHLYTNWLPDFPGKNTADLLLYTKHDSLQSEYFTLETNAASVLFLFTMKLKSSFTKAQIVTKSFGNNKYRKECAGYSENFVAMTITSFDDN
jgi:hypothetical protein